MTCKWLHNYPFCAAVWTRCWKKKGGESEGEEEGDLPKAQHHLGFSMYIRFFRGNYMSQDGNLKSRHGETDWNIQSYLFDTRVSCVEIFQVGVLQETSPPSLAGAGTHITWRDGNNWLREDLLRRNHFKLRFLKVILKPTYRIRIFFNMSFLRIFSQIREKPSTVSSISSFTLVAFEAALFIWVFFFFFFVVLLFSFGKERCARISPRPDEAAR